MGEVGAGGVAMAGREEVGDDGGDEGGRGGEGLEEEVVEQGGEEGGGAELVGEVEGEGACEGRVRQHRRVEEARQRRLRLRVAVRLRLDLPPHPRLLRLGLRRRVRRHHRRRRRHAVHLSRRHLSPYSISLFSTESMNYRAGKEIEREKAGRQGVNDDEGSAEKALYIHSSS
ncbi:unnamed protein product [Musa acuminata subsp. burmannicoides]